MYEVCVLSPQRSNGHGNTPRAGDLREQAGDRELRWQQESRRQGAWEMWRLPFSLLGGLKRYMKRSQKFLRDGLQTQSDTSLLAECRATWSRSPGRQCGRPGEQGPGRRYVRLCHATQRPLASRCMRWFQVSNHLTTRKRFMGLIRCYMLNCMEPKQSACFCTGNRRRRQSSGGTAWPAIRWEGRTQDHYEAHERISKSTRFNLPAATVPTVHCTHGLCTGSPQRVTYARLCHFRQR